MKTLDEVIKAVHHCGLLTDFDDTYEDNGGCPYEDCSECEQKRMLGKDIIHYLEAYRQLSRGLVGENTEIRPEGIYCKVCGTRLDKDWDDENLG